MVRVPEENVNVMMKTDGDNIAGFTVLIAQPNEIVFANLVGDIDPVVAGGLIGSVGKKAMGGELDLGQLMQSLNGVMPAAKQGAPKEEMKKKKAMANEKKQAVKKAAEKQGS